MNQPTLDKITGRIPELDGIRGVAILLVLIWHYIICQLAVEYYSLGASFKVFLAMTWSGVDLFFVLSGFLIGGILLDNKDASNYFKVFYIRRSSRIFPLYYSWLLIFLAISALLAVSNMASPFAISDPAWPYFTYIQNFFMGAQGGLGPRWTGVTWSLALEEQFYLFLPLFIFLLPRRYFVPVIILLIISAPIWRVCLFYSSKPTGFYSMLLMPCRLDSLLLGTLAAYIYRHKEWKEWVAKRLDWIYVALYVLFFLLIFLNFKIRHLSFALINPLAWEMCFYGYSLLALFYFGIVLVAITEKKGAVTFIARNVYLQKLGMISYGVYIYHQSISDLVHGLFLKQEPVLANGQDLLATTAALILTIGISYVSWTYFEKKIVAWGHRFNYNGK